MQHPNVMGLQGTNSQSVVSSPPLKQDLHAVEVVLWLLASTLLVVIVCSAAWNGRYVWFRESRRCCEY
jgi:hypothetical protein